MTKRRFIVLDIIRIGFAVMVFLRHCYTIAGISLKYGEIVMNTTSFVMSGFFIISGFSIQYTHENENFGSGEGILHFYKKRIVTILPLYLFVIIGGVLFNRAWDFLIYVKQLPVNILGIQTWYNEILSYLPYETTWFVSCLFLSYFIYPLLKTIIMSMSESRRVIVLLILLFVSVYSNFVVDWFGCSSIYPNPLFRFVEFFEGVILCTLFSTIKRLLDKISLFLVILSSFVLVMDCTFFRSLSKYENVIMLVFIMSVLIFDDKIKRFTALTRLIEYLGTLSYAFFILQMIFWEMAAKILSFLECTDYKIQIFILLIILVILSAIAHSVIEIPVRRKLIQLLKLN